MPPPGQNQDRIDRDRIGRNTGMGSRRDNSGSGSPNVGSGLSGGGQDSGAQFGNDKKGMGNYGPGIATGITRSNLRDLMDRQRGVTADRSGRPGSEDRPEKQPQTLPSIAAAAAAPTLEALREAADIQNYLTDLQRIALGKSDSQAALERFGVAPEQAMFDYRKSFPEFGDSLANLSLAEITKALGNMSRAPENFAEGGRAGDSFGSRPNQEDTTVSTDLARFTQMLRDLMMMPSETDDGRGIENPFGDPDKPQARRPIQEATPGGLMPQQSQSRPPVSRMEEQVSLPNDIGPENLSNFVRNQQSNMPDPLGREFNARQRYPRPSEIEVETLAPFNPDPQAPPVATAEVRTGNDRPIELEQIGSGADIYSEADRAMAQEAAERNQSYDIPMPVVSSVPEMQLSEDIAEEIRLSEEMGGFGDRQNIDQYRESGHPFGSQDAERIAYYILRSQGLSPQEAKNRIDNMTPEELSQMRPGGFARGGSVLDVDAIAQKARMIEEEEAFPISEIERSLMSPLQEDRREQKGSRIEDRASVAEDMRRLDGVADQRYLELYDNSPNYPAGTGDARKIAYNVLRSQGLSTRDAHTRVNYMTFDELRQVGARGFAGGGSVRGRRDALPMVEGDHVVPAHAVKGNEGGLAALSKKLMGNKNYDGMIRGPGGPREDAIKTRVFAAGGGIAGKMDNLQNPFNSVPARVSDKEYVIPRQAITNLGMMNGAREGDANKAGQDIIYQLVENLKRKA